MFVDKAKIYVKAGDGGTELFRSVVRSMYQTADPPG